MTNISRRRQTFYQRFIGKFIDEKSPVGYIEMLTTFAFTRRWSTTAFLLLLNVCTSLSSAQVSELREARCTVTARGESEPALPVACTIMQDSGLLLIRRSDGVVHDLRPAGDKAGLFMDQNGGSAYASPLEEGSGFRFWFNRESVEVRWDDTN
ncbi:MAG: hypothetical protein AAGC91_14655 [Pseudomonadota bacterium]